MELLLKLGKEVKSVEYIKQPLTTDELKKVLMKLGLKAEDIVRKKDPYFLKKYKGLQFNEDEWITVMTEEPKLIERPIVIKGNKAVVGRPLENVMDLIE